MADQNSSGDSGITIIVGIVALLAIVLIVYFAFLRGGDGGWADIDVSIDPGDAVEAVSE